MYLFIRKFTYCVPLLTILLVSFPAASDSKTFTVGVVPQFDSRKIYKIWRPILNQLERETGHRFILRGAQNIPSFEVECENGLFDFVYMNPYHLVVSNKAQGYIPLVRDTARMLQGVLVVRKDSAVTDVKHLDNKTIAFPAPNAFGASLLLRAEMVDNYGINFIPKYVNTHSSVYLNVLLNTAAAGGGVQKTLDQQPDSIRNDLRVLYRTAKVAPHPFAVHPRVPEAIQITVQKILLNMDNEKNGQLMLSKIPMGKIGKANLADYETIRKMNLQNRGRLK